MYQEQDKKEYSPALMQIGYAQCCGCEACFNACPVDAIKMQRDREGYLVPVLSKESCVNCNLCKKVCPIAQEKKENFDLQSYGLCSTDTDNILRSSSGGIFSVLTDTFLKHVCEQGYIAGAVYSDDFRKVKHICSNKFSDIEKMRGSKYVQSEKGYIYRDIEKLLKNGEYVLFTGVPCEIGALHSFLGKDYENLYTVDIICKGPATPWALEQYVEDVEKKKKSKVTSINMRYKWEKLDVWIPQFIRVDFANGKKLIKEFYNTTIGNTFRIMQRKSCSDCHYNIENHLSDITIGDFHGADKTASYYNHLGTSVLIINSEKGQKLFDMIPSDALKLENVSLDDIYKRNKHIESPQRDRLSELMQKKGMSYAVKHTIGTKEWLKMKAPVKLLRFLTRTYRKIRGI